MFSQGLPISLLLPSPARVMRSDGSGIPNRAGKGAFKEVLEVFKLYKDKRVRSPLGLVSRKNSTLTSFSPSGSPSPPLVHLLVLLPLVAEYLPLDLLQRPNSILLVPRLSLRWNHLVLRHGILPRSATYFGSNSSHCRPGYPLLRRDGSLDLGYRRRDSVRKEPAHH